MKTYNVAILTHTDLDGILSGVIAEAYTNARLDKPCDLFFCDYGNIPKEFDPNKYDLIYVLDFSDKELFKHYHYKLVWLDHHKTAMREFADTQFKNAFCIDGVAACRLVFQYFTNLNYPMLDKDYFIHRKVDEPLFVALAGEYDIWDDKSFYAKPLNFAIQKDYKIIKHLFEKTKTIYAEDFTKGVEFQDTRTPLEIKNLISSGVSMIEYIKQTPSRLDNGIPIVIHGLKGRMFNSDTRSSLVYENGDEDFLLVWNVSSNIQKIKVSLYALKESVDVSEIAKCHGGGGHKGAAGFITYFGMIEGITKGILEDKFDVN